MFWSIDGSMPFSPVSSPISDIRVLPQFSDLSPQNQSNFAIAAGPYPCGSCLEVQVDNRQIHVIIVDKTSSPGIDLHMNPLSRLAGSSDPSSLIIGVPSCQIQQVDLQRCNPDQNMTSIDQPQYQSQLPEQPMRPQAPFGYPIHVNPDSGPVGYQYPNRMINPGNNQFQGGPPNPQYPNPNHVDNRFRMPNNPQPWINQPQFPHNDYHSGPNPQFGPGPAQSVQIPQPKRCSGVKPI